jgi:DNA (cytosine-5)-methyltransferase 1
MPIKYVDLCSGVGGFRAAIENAAHSCRVNVSSVGFSEIDGNSIKSYEANFRKRRYEQNFGDITKINVRDMPDFDMLFAGFPCQPFSIMGNRDGFLDKRGDIFFNIANIISAKQPKFFILENVRGLFTMDGGAVYRKIIGTLESKLGYKTSAFILNSSSYGVPQTRRRLYILGFRDHSQIITEPPKTIDLKKTKTPTTWHILDRKADEKYYISDKLTETVLKNGSGKFKAKSEANQLIARPLSATMHKMHRACQDNYYSDRFIFGHYDKKKYRIILNMDKEQRLRKLTPLEAFRLQGFSDKFAQNAEKAGVSDTQLFRQAGNAITVNVAESVLNTVGLPNYLN